jgi:hypothetical protein
MYLLDTNAVSELRKVRAGKADPGVAAWATSTPAAQLFISAITLHEPQCASGAPPDQHQFAESASALLTQIGDPLTPAGRRMLCEGTGVRWPARRCPRNVGPRRQAQGSAMIPPIVVRQPCRLRRRADR